MYELVSGPEPYVNDWVEPGSGGSSAMAAAGTIVSANAATKPIAQHLILNDDLPPDFIPAPPACCGYLTPVAPSSVTRHPSRPFQLAGRVRHAEGVRAARLVEERVARRVARVGAGCGDRTDHDLRGVFGVVEDAVDAPVGERLEVPTASLAGSVDD